MSAGERVASGDELGLLGNSGDTSFPHVDGQLMDGADWMRCDALPYRFTNGPKRHVRGTFFELSRSLLVSDLGRLGWKDPRLRAGSRGGVAVLSSIPGRARDHRFVARCVSDSHSCRRLTRNSFAPRRARSLESVRNQVGSSSLERIPSFSRLLRAVRQSKEQPHSRRMRRTPRRTLQHQLEFRAWGGARRGAGRKPSGPRARVSHRPRPNHAAQNPLHITLRLRAGLPSLRQKETRNAVSRAFACGGDRFGFRLDQFSLQSNHIHLIAEAEDRASLSRGMQGLIVRVARVLNRLWRRRGSVFADRFHARALRTPREVRTALVYVLQNARRHGLRLLGIDPYSSGWWFDGWKENLRMLREGWRRYGLIGLLECPSRERPRRGEA